MALYYILSLVGLELSLIAVLEYLNVSGPNVEIVLIWILAIFGVFATLQSANGKKWPSVLTGTAIFLTLTHLSNPNPNRLLLLGMNSLVLIIALLLSLYMVQKFSRNKV